MPVLPSLWHSKYEAIEASLSAAIAYKSTRSLRVENSHTHCLPANQKKTSHFRVAVSFGQVIGLAFNSWNIEKSTHSAKTLWNYTNVTNQKIQKNHMKKERVNKSMPREVEESSAAPPEEGRALELLHQCGRDGDLYRRLGCVGAWVWLCEAGFLDERVFFWGERSYQIRDEGGGWGEWHV